MAPSLAYLEKKLKKLERKRLKLDKRINCYSPAIDLYKAIWLGSPPNKAKNK